MIYAKFTKFFTLNLGILEIKILKKNKPGGTGNPTRLKSKTQLTDQFKLLFIPPNSGC